MSLPKRQPFLCSSDHCHVRMLILGCQMVSVFPSIPICKMGTIIISISCRWCERYELINAKY